MDEHTFRVLEFDRVLEMASVFAVTAPGKYAVQKTKPLKNIEEVKRRTGLVSECRNFLSEGRSPGIEHFDDLTHLFQKIRPADAVLAPMELRAFLPLFYSSFNLRILGEGTSYPGLAGIVSGLMTHPHIRKAIEGAIDREGKIRDEASPELSHIRRTIKSIENRIRGILEVILKQKEMAAYMQDFYLAERNNRWVVPVKRGSKGNVPGVVHDISNTGETVYVEPYAIQMPGNELESLRAEEKLEEYRILRDLASLVRGSLSEIEEDYRIVAKVDALQAIAGFSGQMDMAPPEMTEKSYMKIIRGRHPLLWKTLKKESREGSLVPLDVETGRDHSCMVITGSNAGGKTVTLKTIGVLALMSLSGMHVPAGTGTVIPFLNNVLADIGDEQSIEQNLSTFSAHIKRISGIIRRSSAHTLIIIDELGTGTDPEQGGALSCAILRKLKQRGALTLVSTHLGTLKAFAHSEPGMINAAMEMKETSSNGISTYRPTYNLVMGEPGTSHAFEIAESLGLDADVIEEAREFIKDEGGRIESLITELKQKTGDLDNRLKETEKLKMEVEHLRADLKEESSRLKAMEKETLTKALKDAEEVVRKTKREARDIIETLKRATLKEAEEAAISLDRKLDEIVTLQKEHSPEKALRLKEVREGQRVFVNTFGKHGIVRTVNVRTQRCRVIVEGKEITVPLDELSGPSASHTQVPAEKRRDMPRYTHAEATGDINIPGELNVVGKRVDPALSLIERYLNDASLAGLERIKIIHGIGTGILSKAIRAYLKDHPLVESFRKGDEDEGGEAVTVAAL
ncbi:MAG: endonuclease MutS2 [Nitrospiraceae bacterium]|nr:MAG: endonuclease MutS2 [Nitrospiraceae bacterium]